MDNAHGAYLKFLPIDGHPMTLGADACCDSAHKTLPVLTGGDYLHLGACAPKLFFEEAEAAMSLFASTSPSYLILQSLDIANAILSRGFDQAILSVLPAIHGLKQRLLAQGYALVGDEPMKLTIAPKSYGYTGDALSQILREAGIECEFSDADFIVFMLSPALGEEQLASLGRALTELPRREAIQEMPPSVGRPVSVMTVRDAAFAPRERLPIAECLGRVLASMSISCPPAVPIVVSGERITERDVEVFKYYRIDKVSVIKLG
jgi:arginine/lysine/ornithine decarboxylase